MRNNNDKINMALLAMYLNIRGYSFRIESTYGLDYEVLGYHMHDITKDGVTLPGTIAVNDNFEGYIESLNLPIDQDTVDGCHRECIPEEMVVHVEKAFAYFVGRLSAA